MVVLGSKAYENPGVASVLVRFKRHGIRTWVSSTSNISCLGQQVREGSVIRDGEGNVRTAGRRHRTHELPKGRSLYDLVRPGRSVFVVDNVFSKARDQRKGLDTQFKQAV